MSLISVILTLNNRTFDEFIFVYFAVSNLVIHHDDKFCSVLLNPGSTVAGKPNHCNVIVANYQHLATVYV